MILIVLTLVLFRRSSLELQGLLNFLTLIWILHINMPSGIVKMSCQNRRISPRYSIKYL